jgi:hypothetical protein
VIVREVKCTSLLISEETLKAIGRNLSLKAKRYWWSTGAARHDSMETMTDFKLSRYEEAFWAGGEGRGGGGWGDKS